MLSHAIGILFSLAASFFIGASFVINKFSTDRLKLELSEGLRSQESDAEMTDDDDMLSEASMSTVGLAINKRRQSVGLAFLRSWYWWLFLLMTGAGELCNMMAYLFAPATLVAPLGCISMVVTCVGSHYFLKEPLDGRKQIGILLAGLGSGLIVSNAPSGANIKSLEQLLGTYIVKLPFIIYGSLNLAAALTMLLLRKRHYIYRLLFCSLWASIVVISARSIGISFAGVISQDENTSPFTNPAFYIIMAILAVSIVAYVLQITKAVSKGDVNVVIPVYYVLNTTSIVVGNNIVFQEYTGLTAANVVTLLAGFGVSSIAVFHIQYTD